MEMEMKLLDEHTKVLLLCVRLQKQMSSILWPLQQLLYAAGDFFI